MKLESIAKSLRRSLNRYLPYLLMKSTSTVEIGAEDHLLKRLRTFLLFLNFSRQKTSESIFYEFKVQKINPEKPERETATGGQFM